MSKVLFAPGHHICGYGRIGIDTRVIVNTTFNTTAVVSHSAYHRSKYMMIGLILCLHPVNERRRYFVTTSLIGWPQTYNQPCNDLLPRMFIIERYRIIISFNMIYVDTCTGESFSSSTSLIIVVVLSVLLVFAAHNIWLSPTGLCWIYAKINQKDYVTRTYSTLLMTRTYHLHTIVNRIWQDDKGHRTNREECRLTLWLNCMWPWIKARIAYRVDSNELMKFNKLNFCCYGIAVEYIVLSIIPSRIKPRLVF